MSQEKLPILGHTKSDRRWPSSWTLAPLLGGGIAVCLMIVALATSGTKLSPADDENRLFQNTLVGSPSAAIDSYELNPDGSRNLLKECQELYITQTLDHFGVGAPTYEQRYFVCDKYAKQENNVIFFYVGNEADVELYLNNTGLMWENAAEFGATLVFAEHRYFGKSLPFSGKNIAKHIRYLSSAQTLADYAVLITHIKQTNRWDVPVIGFGGSYGGMLGTWFRTKYPHIIDGIIAASAPIVSYIGDERPPDMGAGARIITFDASPEAGSAANCIPNVRRTWEVIEKWGQTEEGRKQLQTAFALCDDHKLTTKEDVVDLMSWARDAFDAMSMGNYPYPTSYMMNGKSELPAYPMRVACSHLKEGFTDDWELLRAFRDSIGVYYNSTADQKCYDLGDTSEESAQDDNLWEYLYCTELYGGSSFDGVNDMFWSAPWNLTADNKTCMDTWEVPVRPMWPITEYGGWRALHSASNILLSNGNYDPCAGGGVLENVSDSVVALRIDGGAHHLDLFFSHPLDPPAVTAARETEKAYIRKWVREFYDRKATLTTKTDRD